MAVPAHTHNGVDSQQIRSSNLIPYDINPPVSYFDRATQGSILLFDYATKPQVVGLDPFYNWGERMFLGYDIPLAGTISQQSWSEINYADFYVDAHQTISQNIAGNDDEVIVFNSMNSQKPFSAYNDLINPIDGFFLTIKNPSNQNMIYGAPELPVFYMVTAQVQIAPSAGVAQGDYVTIGILVDGVLIHGNVAYFVPDAAGNYDTLSISASISVLMTTPILDNICVKIYNQSAVAVSTDVSTGSITNYFKIKQLK